MVFSHPLITGPVDRDNYSVRYNNQRFTIADAGVGPFPPTVLILLWSFPGVPDAGPDVVDFSPPPFDLISDTARQIPAPGFTDYPITP